MNIHYALPNRKLKLATAVALACFSPMVYALGLGNLTVDSQPGHPFRATIPIITQHSKKLQGASAQMADSTDFSQLHLKESASLSHWNFSVETGRHPAIVVTSSLPAPSSATHILVQFNWTGGKIVREYTILPHQSSEPSPVIHHQKHIVRHVVHKHNTSGWAAVQSYGPVEPGSTLFGIVSSIARDAHYTIDQIMMAIVHANPWAFIDGNPNLMKSYVRLRIPSAAEVMAYSPVQASQWIASFPAVSATSTTASKSSQSAKNSSVTGMVSMHSAPPVAASRSSEQAQHKPIHNKQRATQLVLSSAPKVPHTQVSVSHTKSATTAVHSAVSQKPTTSVKSPSISATVSTTPTASSAEKNGSVSASLQVIQAETAELTSTVNNMALILNSVQKQNALNSQIISQIISKQKESHTSSVWKWAPLGGNLILLLLFIWLYRRQNKNVMPDPTSTRRDKDIFNTDSDSTTLEDDDLLPEIVPYTTSSSTQRTQNSVASESSQVSSHAFSAEKELDSSTVHSEQEHQTDPFQLHKNSVDRVNAESASHAADKDQSSDSSVVDMFSKQGWDFSSSAKEHDGGLDMHNALELDTVHEPKPSNVEEKKESHENTHNDALLDGGFLSLGSIMEPHRDDVSVASADDEKASVMDSSAEEVSHEAVMSDDASDWDSVGTKLDLAKAYIEMDDFSSAEELLHEVIKDGNSKQRSDAQILLDSMH